MDGQLEVKNITHIFESGTGKIPDRVIALKDISFTVGEGEFVSIIGPSGCGKSTLLKIIAGLIIPTEGAVSLPSVTDSNSLPIGFVFQDAVLLPWKTALQNALFPFEVMGKDMNEHKPAVKDLFRLAGLEGFENSYPKQLSGGMRQRVSIVRSLSYNPSLLLMDEPFGAIDAITRDSLNDILLNIWRETKKTILFVTHDIAEAVYLSDRVIVLGTKPGRIIEEASITLERPRREDTKLDPRYYGFVKSLREKLK